MAHDVFVSYSTHDQAVANAICDRLEAAGVRCWIAPRDILPGDTWAGAIMRAIAETRLMLLVFSGRANTSPQILREVERAVNRGVVVVPVRIEDVQPAGDLEYFLGSHQWLDAFPPPLERHLERISSVIPRVLDPAARGSTPRDRVPEPAAARPSPPRARPLASFTAPEAVERTGASTRTERKQPSPKISSPPEPAPRKMIGWIPGSILLSASLLGFGGVIAALADVAWILLIMALVLLGWRAIAR